MILTINTDASYYIDEKVGGFAFWAKCDLFTFKYSGPIKNPKGSTDCELKAIANALYMIAKKTNYDRFEKVHINTDSLNSIEMIQRQKWRNNNIISLILDIVSDITKTGSLTMKHVKAHKGTDTPRKYINNWCDRMAKMEAKKQLV